MISKIEKSFKENYAAKELISLLIHYGISPKIAIKAYGVLGYRAVELVKENPYCLIKIKGISFDVADRMAASRYALYDKSKSLCIFHIVCK